MNADLQPYAHLRVCVALSGGRDSMALLHYLNTHGKDYGITLCALNCDHKIRGEASARDSAFVRAYCADNGIPAIFYEWDGEPFRSEEQARIWRRECYKSAVLPHEIKGEKPWLGADCVALAHHADDNAETVLFNIARGAALSGACGIKKETVLDGVRIIRPLISCTRREIDEYVAANSLPYVDDDTNFTDLYTRNKIRLNVLPELEKAIPNTVGAIYRFSRLAEEDEKYLSERAQSLISLALPEGYAVAHCEEKVLFRRAAVKIIAGYYKKKDYTLAEAERLYSLQFAESGKIFKFLSLAAYAENGRVVICRDEQPDGEELLSKYAAENKSEFCGQELKIITAAKDCDLSRTGARKTLKFDWGVLPKETVIRFMRAGDKFTRFGGITKNLGDYFTDKKITKRARAFVPVAAVGNEIYIVFGVEISEKVKVTEKTVHTAVAESLDYLKI